MVIDRTLYDQRHGGPFDRGSADAYYRRPRNPHYYEGATLMTPQVTELSEAELEAYHAGYDWTEENGHFKW